jgi:hypothetical protein
MGVNGANINSQDDLYCNEVLERPNIIKLSEEYRNYTVDNGHLINFEANKLSNSPLQIRTLKELNDILIKN